MAIRQRLHHLRSDNDRDGRGCDDSHSPSEVVNARHALSAIVAKRHEKMYMTMSGYESEEKEEEESGWEVKVLRTRGAAIDSRTPSRSVFTY